MEGLTLAQIRQMYPQYANMGDEEIAARYHAKYGQGTNFMDFLKGFMGKLSPVGTAEAGEVTSPQAYGLGGNSIRMGAIQDAARDPSMMATRPTMTRRPEQGGTGTAPVGRNYTYEQKKDMLNRWIAEQQARERAKAEAEAEEGRNSMMDAVPGEEYGKGKGTYRPGIGWVDFNPGR